MRREGIHRAFESQIFLAGDFYKAAVARLRAATSRNVAVEARDIVRPDDDLAAVAAIDGVSVDSDVLANKCAVGILHVRIFPLEIAAD